MVTNEPSIRFLLTSIALIFVMAGCSNTSGEGSNSTGGGLNPAGGSPSVVSDEEASPSALIVYDGILYWSDSNGYAIRSYDPTTEEVSTVVETPGRPRDMAKASNGFYWINRGPDAFSEENGLWWKAEGDEPVHLDRDIPQDRCHGTVEVYDGHVYCGGGPRVIRRTVGQNDHERLCGNCGPSNTRSLRFAFTNDRLYLAFKANATGPSSVGFMPLEGGSFEELHSEPGTASQVHVDGDHVYWLATAPVDSDDRGVRLRRMPLDGGEVENVLGPLPSLGYWLIDGVLYYLERSDDTIHISSSSPDGNDPVLLTAIEAEGTFAISGLQVIGDTLYWIDNTGGRNGRVMSVELP